MTECADESLMGVPLVLSGLAFRSNTIQQSFCCACSFMPGVGLTVLCSEGMTMQTGLVMAVVGSP